MESYSYHTQTFLILPVSARLRVVYTGVCVGGAGKVEVAVGGDNGGERESCCASVFKEVKSFGVYLASRCFPRRIFRSGPPAPLAVTPYCYHLPFKLKCFTPNTSALFRK